MVLGTSHILCHLGLLITYAGGTITSILQMKLMLREAKFV